MKVKLVRHNTDEQGTIGTLFIDGTYFCVTGELPKYAGKPEVENEQRTDCIPAGTYTCAIVNSPKFGKVYTVKNVKGRSHILIHAGNYFGDKAKGYRSDVEGCILLGKKEVVLNNQKAINSSKGTVKEFMRLLNGKDFTLEVIDDFRD